MHCHNWYFGCLMLVFRGDLALLFFDNVAIYKQIIVDRLFRGFHNYVICIFPFIIPGIPRKFQRKGYCHFCYCLTANDTIPIKIRLRRTASSFGHFIFGYVWNPPISRSGGESGISFFLGISDGMSAFLSGSRLLQGAALSLESLRSNSSVSGISSSRTKFSKVITSGKLTPVSHLLTAVTDTWTKSASFCWLKFFSFLRFLISAPKRFFVHSSIFPFYLFLQY